MANDSFIIIVSDTNNCTDTTNISVSRDEFLYRVQEEYNITMVPAAIFLIIIAITSVIGNTVVLNIYCQKFTLNATKYLLMVIAFYDMMTAIIVIPIEMFLGFNTWNLKHTDVCKTKATINAFTSVMCTFLLVAVAFASYRKVCHPFEWQVTVNGAKKICIFATLCGLFGATPFVHVYGGMSKPTKECSKISGNECYIDDGYKYTMWPMLTSWMFICFYIFCVISLLVLYMRIGKTALKHRKQVSIRAKINKNINCNNTTLKKSQVNREQIKPEELLNSKKWIRCPSSQTEVQSLTSPDICRESPDDEYCKNGTGKKPLEASVTMETISLKINSQNVIMLDCIEHQCPKRKEYFSKTRMGMFLQNEQKGEEPWIRESNGQILSEDFNENKSNEIYSNERNKNRGSDVDGKKPADVAYETALYCVRENSRKSKRSQGYSTEMWHSDAASNFYTGVLTPADPPRRKTMNRTVIILILISAIYATTYLSYILLDFYKMTFRKKYMNLSTVELSVFNLISRMYFMNIATNPIIYSFCDNNFRRECKNWFRRTARKTR